MGRNAIVLTSGLTGSSVLAGLISRAGYWVGDDTQKKEDYDTYENKELIELNLRLFREAGYRGNYLVEFSPEAMARVGSLHGQIDPSAYQQFVKKCADHRPWIWKDPRLWMTIRFWKHFLDSQDCRYILLTRGSVQSWVSATLRRQIRSYRSLKSYEARIQSSVLAFLKETKASYLHVSYEELIRHPARTIDQLNGHLETGLTVADLKSVYHKPLYENPRASYGNYLKAALIYLKNYSERVDVAPKRQ
jgi:hypothetical protein